MYRQNFTSRYKTIASHSAYQNSLNVKTRAQTTSCCVYLSSHFVVVIPQNFVVRWTCAIQIAICIGVLCVCCMYSCRYQSIIAISIHILILMPETIVVLWIEFQFLLKIKWRTFIVHRNTWFRQMFRFHSLQSDHDHTCWLSCISKLVHYYYSFVCRSAASVSLFAKCKRRCQRISVKFDVFSVFEYCCFAWNVPTPNIVTITVYDFSVFVFIRLTVKRCTLRHLLHLEERQRQSKCCKHARAEEKANCGVFVR